MPTRTIRLHLSARRFWDANVVIALRSVLLTSFLAVLATARPQTTTTDNLPAVSTPVADPLFGLVTVDCGCWSKCSILQQSPETADLQFECPLRCGI